MYGWSIAHTEERIQKKLYNATGWFKLNDGIVSPGGCPRCFFDTDRETLTARLLCAVAKTSPDVCLFCLTVFFSPDCTSVKISGIVGPP